MGGAHECLLKGVLKLQKKAVRIITGSKFRAHTDELFISTKIMDVYKVYKYSILLFMFKCDHNLLPPNLFNEWFDKNIYIHDHFTRQQHSLHVPKSRHTVVHKSVCFTGVALWNNFLTQVDTNCSLGVFKSRVRSIILYEKATNI